MHVCVSDRQIDRGRIYEKYKKILRLEKINETSPPKKEIGIKMEIKKKNHRKDFVYILHQSKGWTQDKTMNM